MLSMAELKDKPILRTNEIARILGVNEDTVRDMLRNGKIPGTLVGKTWYTRRDELMTALKSTNGFVPGDTIVLPPNNSGDLTLADFEAVRAGKRIVRCER